MSQLRSQGRIKADGALVGTKAGTVEFTPGGEKREGQVFDGQFYVMATLVPAEVKAKIAHTSKTERYKLNSLKNATVEVIWEDGGVEKLYNAYRTGDPLRSTDSDGTIDLTIQGEIISK